MFSDWQSITVALIVLAALAYLGRRAFRRLRSMSGGQSADACGSCCSGEPAKQTSAPRALVQITGPRTTPTSPAPISRNR